MSENSDSEYSDSDAELQNAFAQGLLKPGLNKVEKPQKNFVNNVTGLRQKLQEFKLDLPWIEILDAVNKPAPLAPELEAQVIEQEQKRENARKNNKKLPQVSAAEDPVLNDFKREMMFYRQAQAAVLEIIPKLKALDFPTKRPEDYFAEMAKTDEHMHKVRENLMKKQVQQQRSEKVKQLRAQRKEGKALQIQTKLQRQQEKKQILEQVKKVRKGLSKDMDFLENKPGKNNNSKMSKRGQDKRKWRDQKFGFGGKKKGSKMNTKDSSADISEYKRTPKVKGGKGNRGKMQQRPGKNRRTKMKNRQKRK